MTEAATHASSAGVRVARHYRRSIRIDSDFGVADALHGYVPIETARSALETVARQVAGSNQRAFTWTGPYGGGKSSLAIALGSAVCGDRKLRDQARQVLDVTKIEQFDDAFPVRRFGWLVVPVVGSRGSAVTEINATLHRVRAQKETKANARALIAELLDHASGKRYDGVLLLIDEMGKFLEAAAAGGHDLHFFQELAEAAARSKGRLVVIGILHQSFRQYASKLGIEAREEWAKVQGRYSDIPLVTTGNESIDLLSRAIECDASHPKSMQGAEVVAQALGARASSDTRRLAKTLDQCWPLHPVTAALLGPMSRRQFGQNERSVYGFLSSAEPRGFQAFLADWNGRDTFGPDRLWDYLKSNLEPAILTSSDGHRWAQAAEAIDRAMKKGVTELGIELIKSIALIGLLRSASGLAADPAVLESLHPKLDSKEIDRALDQLSQWRVIVSRKHLGGWAIFEGSDFDLDAAVGRARATFLDPDLATLSRIAELHPVVAKRHYHETGTFRWMGACLLRLEDAESFATSYRPEQGEFGRLAIVLFGRGVPPGLAIRRLKSVKCELTRPVAFGVPENHATLNDLGSEILSLKIVQTTSAELEGDGVARRETQARLAAVSSRFEEEMHNALSNARWIVNGVEQDEPRVASIASVIAAETFPSAPRVWSELVNRNEVSSNSVKARRDLLHRMVVAEDAESLGIDGYPAERGLYETVLAKTGLHRADADGVWRFREPSGRRAKEHLLHPIWKETTSILKDAEGPVSARTILDRWAAPPFGLSDGLKPILLLALILAHRDRIACYREGVFMSSFTDADVDELLQDESRFSFRWVARDEARRELLAAAASAIGSAAIELRELDPLAVARSLVAAAFELPQWSRRTARVSPQAQTVRNVLLRASDPHKLLFVDLPSMLGEHNPNAYTAALRTAITELRAAYPEMIESMRELLLEAMDARGENHSTLAARAELIANKTGELELDAFAMRLQQPSASEQEWVEGILSLAVRKPAREWTDLDIDAAKLAIAELALRFRRAEVLVRVQSRDTARDAFALVQSGAGVSKAVVTLFEVSARDRSAVQRAADDVLALLRSRKISPSLHLAALALAGRTAANGTSEHADES